MKRLVASLGRVQVDVASKGERQMAMAGRKDWVQADLRCLMCGRVIGRLVGPLPTGDPEKRSLAGRSPQFAAFRPNDRSVDTGDVC